MTLRSSLWAAVTGLCACIAPAPVLAATATLVRIMGPTYTLDAGRAEGIVADQEVSVLKNGVAVARLKVSALRSHEADATLLQADPNVVIRLGDTVSYEPSVVPAPPAPLPSPPPTPGAPGPNAPAPSSPTPEPQPDLLNSDIDLRSFTGEESSLTNTLIEAGLENVYVSLMRPDGIYVEYENRRWRWEIDAIGEVMRTVAEAHTGGDMVLVGKQRGVPAYQVRVGIDDFRAYLGDSMSDEEFRQKLRVTWPTSGGHSGDNPSYRKLDVTLGEGLRGNITTFPGTSAPGIQTRLRLGVQSDLFKGLRLRFREWIPLNHVSNFSHEPTVDVGEATYARRIAPKLYGLAGVGAFREGYGGVRGEANYFPTKDDALAASFGKIGNGLGDLRRFSYQGAWRHQLPHVDAQLFARGGRFLAGDRGGTFGFSTQFRERTYEFAYTKTNIDKLLTLTLRWPLGQRQYPRPGSLRFRQEPDFRVSFSQTGIPIGRTFPTDGWADNWQIAALPATLPNYLAFLRGPEGSSPALQESMRDVPDSAMIGPSLSGSTGLWFVPAAAVEPYGYFTLGADWVDRKYRQKYPQFSGKGTMAEYLTFGALPRLEITLRLTNQEGKLGIQRYNFPINGATSSGWNVDKEVSAQYLLWNEKGNRPAVLLGAQDFAGSLGNISVATQYRAYYGVASKHFGSLGVHAGVGTRTLKGVFFGADQPISSRIRILGDFAHDSTTPKKNKVTLGVRAEVVKNVRVNLYSPGLNTFGAGVTWTRRM